MITLYGMGSPNVIKVMVMLEECGLPYRFERCDVILGQQHEPAFRALNPNGKVPVLADDDGPGGVPIVLAESGAILFYLAERTGRFLPAEPADRYRAIQWLMFQMAGVGPTLGQAIHFAAVSPGHDYPTRRFALEMDRLLDVLDERLSRSACIAADAYSIADMAVLPWLRPLGRFFPDLRPRPNLERWRLELSTRPAVMRTDALAAKLAAQDAASFKAATPAMLDRYFGRSAPTPA